MKPIVEADWLRAHSRDGDLVLIDVRSSEVYASSHIPGAHLVNVYDYFAATDAPGISDLNAYVSRMLAPLSLSGRETVVFYEDETGMVAPRGLWFYEYAGLARGCVLDGGFSAWKTAGGGVVSGSERWGGQGALLGAHPAPEAQFVVTPNLSVLATADDLLHLDTGHSVLLDVRRESEFVGTWEQVCCPRSGRIDGAIRLYWEELIAKGKYAPPVLIRRRLDAAGLSADKDVIVYCHRGGRSAAAFYALRLAGFEHVRNYIGSWHEWSNRPDLPITTG